MTTKPITSELRFTRETNSFELSIKNPEIISGFFFIRYAGMPGDSVKFLHFLHGRDRAHSSRPDKRRRTVAHHGNPCIRCICPGRYNKCHLKSACEALRNPLLHPTEALPYLVTRYRLCTASHRRLRRLQCSGTQVHKHHS